ncbi:MAG: phosphatase PAP2 family protein [Steroidobacteraceae bacterium]
MILRSLRDVRLGTIIAMLLVASALWVFLEVADEVLDGETRQFDERVLLAFRSAADSGDPLGPGWVEELARDVTGLGSVVVLTFLTLAAAGFLLLERKRHLAVYVLAAIVSGTIGSSLLKFGFDRPRPDLVAHGHVVYTSSFPSGHSMMSALVFLTLGVLLATAQVQRVMQFYVLALAILLTVAVGLSRVYLGVHWPTDVLAGWAAGSGWAFLCWGVADFLRNRGRIE